MPIQNSTSPTSSSLKLITGLTIGISTSITALVAFIIILVVVLQVHPRRKATKLRKNSEYQGNGRYSPHEEENINDAQLQATVNSYEQVHLSPSTEFITSTEYEPISNISWQPQADYQGIYSCIDMEQPNPVSQEMEEDDLMYDVVGKGNDKMQYIDSHDGPSVVSNNITNDEGSGTDDSKPRVGENTLAEMYAVVNKKLKVEKEGAPPGIHSHVVDESYTQTVQKDPKSNATVDGEEASPGIPHNRVEELYTTVKKKPKGDNTEEIPPPIPPHTVEELYTAVQKKPKESITKGEEEAPPIPLYTVDKLSCSSGNDN